MTSGFKAVCARAPTPPPIQPHHRTKTGSKSPQPRESAAGRRQSQRRWRRQATSAPAAVAAPSPPYSAAASRRPPARGGASPLLPPFARPPPQLPLAPLSAPQTVGAFGRSPIVPAQAAQASADTRGGRPTHFQNLSGFPDKFVRKTGQTVFAMYLCPSGALGKCQASTVLSPIGSNTIHKVKITLYLLFTPQEYPIWDQCLYGFPYKSSFARCCPGNDGAKAAGIAMPSMRSRRAVGTAFFALRHRFGAGMAGMVCSADTTDFASRGAFREGSKGKCWV